MGDFWSFLSLWDLSQGGAGVLWTPAAPADRDGGVWMCPTAMVPCNETEMQLMHNLQSVHQAHAFTCLSF